MAVERKRIGRPRAHGNATPAALWLRERFDRLEPRLSVRRPDWGAVLVEMARSGITHGGGEPPAPLTEATLRKMWRRVRVDLCAGIKAATVVAAMPAEASARTWAPEPVRPSVAPAEPASGDYLADMRAELNRRSGRR